VVTEEMDKDRHTTVIDIEKTYQQPIKVAISTEDLKKPRSAALDSVAVIGSSSSSLLWSSKRLATPRLLLLVEGIPFVLCFEPAKAESSGVSLPL